MAENRQDIVVVEAQLARLAQSWEAESPKLGEIGDLARRMQFAGGGTDTNLFPRSIVRYGTLVSTVDAAGQEGAAVTAAIGATLRVVVLVYRHADAAALAAAANLRRQVAALGGLP
jgi:hypothetical protein